MKKSSNIINSSAFKRGYSQVPLRHRVAVREDISEICGITGTATARSQSWYRRVNGIVELRLTEARKIEEVFHNYSITDIWGDN